MGLLIFFTLNTVLKAKTVKVSQALAQIGTHILTSREVELNTAIEAKLFATETQKHEYAQKINSVLLEWVVFLEAQGIGVAEPSEEAITQKFALIKQQLRQEGVLAQYEVQDAEIRETLHRKLVAKDFIRFKSNSALIPISDEEAQTYFQKNKIRFGQDNFASFKESIKKHLAQQESDRRLRNWFEVLQKKHRIRLFQAGADK